MAPRPAPKPSMAPHLSSDDVTTPGLDDVAGEDGVASDFDEMRDDCSPSPGLGDAASEDGAASDLDEMHDDRSPSRARSRPGDVTSPSPSRRQPPWHQIGKRKLSPAGADSHERSRREPKRRREPPSEATSAKLFVGQLAFKATEDDLHDVFRSFDVAEVKIVKDKISGKPRGYGFITFADIEQAEEAIRTMQGAEVAGRAIKLERTEGNQHNMESSGNHRASSSDGMEQREREDQGEDTEPPLATSLFIGRLSKDTTEDDIRVVFSSFDLIDVRVIRRVKTGESRRYGFITFATSDQAEEALQTMKGVKVAGIACKLQRTENERYSMSLDSKEEDAGQQDDSTRSPTLFLGQIPFEATEDDVHDTFSNFEDVSVNITRDRKTGRSRGYGFITFADGRQAEQAFQIMQGADVAGRPCKLEYTDRKLKRSAGDAEQEPDEDWRHHTRRRTDETSIREVAVGEGRLARKARSKLSKWERSQAADAKQGRTDRRRRNSSPVRSIRWAEKPARGKDSSDPCKLFIGGLPYEAREGDISDACSHFGDFSVKLVMNPATGNNKGFCFVTFADAEQAEEALRNPSIEIMGVPLELMRSGKA
eukprot:TRINITY_DN27443_c0_g1_i1.p1 TRINITY_DN27443_c0_g1~~TRINITY_DN27443_c0_g1_i1.p1  ORF type:complete len:594 (+),score=100.29 TRINITY_DN27443_c0_g1_i1:94-1875(+)